MRYAYLVVMGLIAAQVAYYYGRLPDVVASHFGANGLANGFMSRAGFVGFYVGLVLFLMAVFAAVSALLRAVPTELINVPNKEYWFSGEREQSSRAWLSRDIQILGLGVVVFVAIVMQRVFMANVSGERPCLPTKSILVSVGVLMVFMLSMAGRMLRRFSGP